MDQSEVLKKLIAYKRLIKDHFDLDTIYLYGSYARVSQHEDSDIDVTVVVNSIEDDYFTTRPLLWQLRREIDDRIEPILINKNYDRLGFLAEVKKDGIEIKDA